MTYNEFKENFLPEFLEITSFQNRIKYCRTHLELIGRGSSRMVFNIDGEKVMKLAMNRKGIAQNETESSTGKYEYNHGIVAIVYESAENDTWMISERAVKVTENRIKQLTEIPSLAELHEFLMNFTSENNGKGKPYKQAREVEEFFWENEFAQEIQDLIANHSLNAGDMGRPSSYGEVLRNNIPCIVLIDTGMTDDIMSTHYNEGKLQELFGYSDGNDDMLSDIGGGQDIRNGIVALAPDGVGDGDYVNESLVEFISNRSEYPNKRIDNIGLLSDYFHEAVNNLKEIIDVVENKETFFDNLLSLQEYLVEHAHYNRDLLVKEDGSAKFSTGDAVGSDGFPTHNNNDTSPSIRNNMDANSAMYEDLEYKHVDGDATDDKYMIGEDNNELLSSDSKNKFNMWFNGSSIVDESGYPLIAYHGQPPKYECNLKGGVDRFEPEEIKSFNNKNPRFLKKNNKGFYFTLSNSEASDYSEGGKVYDVYLRITKPYMFKPFDDNEKLIRNGCFITDDEYNELIRLGYDGVIILTPFNDSAHKRGNWGEIIAFYPNQIKSINNNGSFDIESDEIINEVIDASQAHSEEGSISSVLNGSRDIGFLSLYKDEQDKLDGLQYLMLKPEPFRGFQNYVIYKDSHGEKNARALYDIALKHSGYLNDKTPKEAYSIGKLLGYSEDSIGEYVNKKYKMISTRTQRSPRNFNENLQIQEYFGNIAPMNEQGIMRLQDLPFKEEVQSVGGKIFSVGGAVRDEFLGKESKDLDILVTGIPMNELEKMLSKYGRVDAVGKSFGVLKFKPKGAAEDIDVAIPRTETVTGDGGHKGFDVTSDHELPLEKDLERRDFTINAIAKDIDGNLIDPYNGQEDLKNKIIRVVNPDAFSDDPLRMLRGVQFASRFGFKIEPETAKMISNNASRIKEIPPERILIEFDKIVKKGDAYVGAFLLKSLGLTPQIFGGDGGLYVSNDWDKVERMSEFIWFLGRHLTQNIAEFFKSNLKGDINTYKELKALQHAFQAVNETNVVKLRTIAHNVYITSKDMLQSGILPESLSSAANDLMSGKYPKSLGELAVNGNDLMNRGLNGKAIGDTLKSLLMKIYADEVRNIKEDLVALLNKSDSKIQEDIVNETKRQQTWNINGKLVGLSFFIDAYDKWNKQGGTVGYSNPSRSSVLEFLQNNFEDESTDKTLNNHLYWHLIDREILNEDDVVKKINYSAVVLDDKSRTQLIQVVKPMIPEHWDIIAHHMTIKLGALDDGSEAQQDMNSGKEITLKTIDYAFDDLVIAVGVEGYPTTNQKAHITIAVNREEGGKPYLSNKLRDWKALKIPMSLTGKISEE